MKNLQIAFAFLLALVASSFSLSTRLASPPEHGLPQASVDFYLKLEGINGESTAAGHEGWIEIQSVSWNKPGKIAAIRRQSTATASPMLQLACAQGQHFPRAVLHQRKAPNSTAFLEIKLENVLITSYQTSGGSSALPMESMSLNYTKVIW